jgi:hypothetical protein
MLVYIVDEACAHHRGPDAAWCLLVITVQGMAAPRPVVRRQPLRSQYQLQYVAVESTVLPTNCLPDSIPQVEYGSDNASTSELR